ncbi:MAG: hypothetical protein RJB13_403 [Pseudomonadota bacterium]
MFIFRWLRLIACLAATIPCVTFSANSEQGLNPNLTSEFVVGLEEFPETLDPRAISFSQLEQSLEHLLFLPLISSSPSGLPQFVLAESASFKSPELLEIELRSGIRFANGREIIADDVVATYGYILGKFNADRESPRKDVFSNVLSISRVAIRTIHVALKSPDASILSQLTVGILPREIFMQNTPNGKIGAQLRGLGAESGPFVLSKFGDREFVLRRNTRYTGAPYGGSLPMSAKVRFKLFGSRQAIYDGLLSGEIHLVQNSLDSFHLSELRAKHSSRFRVQQVVADETWFLGLNFQRKIFSDLRLRRAMALAIDRKEILNFSLFGEGLQAKSIFPPRHYLYPASLESISPAEREARLLIESTGFQPLASQKVEAVEQPSKMHFSISVPMEKERIAIAKAVAGQLRSVGLKVGIDVSDYATFINKLKLGNMDAWIAPWSGFRDGDLLRFALHSHRRPPVGANYGAYNNEELDTALDKALRTLNQSERKRLYERAQRIIANDFPYILLWHSLNFAVSNRNVQGFEVFPDARLTSLGSVRAR